MNRPICAACNQRLCAVNYHRNGITYYRSRCGICAAKNRKIKPPEPRWLATGYKKKPTCERCGFRARYSAQLLVYHMDANLNNSSARNLKTICLNCVEEVRRSDLPWRAGDLEPDY